MPILPALAARLSGLQEPWRAGRLMGGTAWGPLEGVRSSPVEVAPGVDLDNELGSERLLTGLTLAVGLTLTEEGLRVGTSLDTLSLETNEPVRVRPPGPVPAKAVQPTESWHSWLRGLRGRVVPRCWISLPVGLRSYQQRSSAPLAALRSEGSTRVCGVLGCG